MLTGRSREHAARNVESGSTASGCKTEGESELWLDGDGFVRSEILLRVVRRGGDVKLIFDEFGGLTSFGE
jgi:hypothetical protein